MDRNRIIKFLDSLEEQGILAPGQQSVVLQTKEDDVVAGSNKAGCSNETYESCGGSDNYNSQCKNYGVACAGSKNDGCTNGTIVTNKSVLECKQGA